MNHYQGQEQAGLKQRLFLQMRWLYLVLVLGLLLGACSVIGAAPSIQPLPSPTPDHGDIPQVLKVVLDPIQTPAPPLPPAAPPPSDPPSQPVPVDPAQVPETAPPPPDPAAPPTGITSRPALAYNNPALAASLQQVLDNAAASPHHPGVVMLISLPEQGTWVGASGFSDRAMQTPLHPDDRFRIASITKTFVATVVLQLVQEGTLRLDDTVERWVPGLVPNGHVITIRHLLSHTSGLYDYLDGAFEHRYFAQNPLRVWRPLELVRHGVAHNPYFAPGEPGRWKYSNTNYVLLGMIIERSTGSTLAHELRSRLFVPLGLHQTFLEDYEDIPGGFVHGYIGSGDYTYASLSTWAAGGIVSNATDLATFAQALFTGRLLNPEMMDQMLAFTDLSGYPVYGLGVARNVEEFALATQGVMPSPSRYPLIYGHTGGLSGFKSVVGYLPDRRITVVVLMNQMSVPIIPIVLEGLDATVRGY